MNKRDGIGYIARSQVIHQDLQCLFHLVRGITWYKIVSNENYWCQIAQHKNIPNCITFIIDLNRQTNQIQ